MKMFWGIQKNKNCFLCFCFRLFYEVKKGAVARVEDWVKESGEKID